MSDIRHQLQRLFAAPEWQVVDTAGTGATLPLFFESSYALIGIVAGVVPEVILQEWPSWQVSVNELRNQNATRQSKDMYLVFVVKAVPDDRIGELQGIIADTRVCRKVLLEQGERSLKEVLMETPFIPFARPQLDGADAFAESLHALAGEAMSAQVLDDLRRRSPEVILSGLLENRYTGANTDETESHHP